MRYMYSLFIPLYKWEASREIQSRPDARVSRAVEPWCNMRLVSIASVPKCSTSISLRLLVI